MVDFNAIKYNAMQFKGKIGNAKLCAVIKNDAYGHGLLKTAKTLVGVADFFAVATVSEAQKVAELGVPTLILLPLDKRDTEKAVSSGFVLTVDGFSTLETVSQVAQKLGKTVHVHVKIDTGMHRFGFMPNELPMLCQRLKNCKNVSVEGIFSHFSRADCDVNFTKGQFDCFCNASALVERELGKKLIRHVANTSAISLDNRYALDMVRVGLGLYGYGKTGLIPAKEVKSKIVAVRKVDKNQSLGYGVGEKFNHDAFVAVVQIGYANGLPRVLSDKMTFFVNGRPCKQVGKVCMSCCMIEVDQSVKTGDTVTILGKNCNPSNDDVIIYELLCSLR